MSVLTCIKETTTKLFNSSLEKRLLIEQREVGKTTKRKCSIVHSKFGSNGPIETKY